jgi:hypothetical protein
MCKKMGEMNKMRNMGGKKGKDKNEIMKESIYLLTYLWS